MRHNIIKAASITLATAALLTCTEGITTSAATSGLQFAENSRLADGKWIKVAVTHTGVCRISYDELRAMGFSDPAKVGVFGRGGAAMTGNFTDASGNVIYTDDLPPVAVMHRADALYFYAQGTTLMEYTPKGVNRKSINVYADKAYYFLSDSQSDVKEMSEADTSGTSDTGRYTSAIAWQLFEEDNIHPYGSSEEFFGWDIATMPGRSLSMPYSIPGGTAGGKLTVSLRGAAKITGPETMTVSLTSGGQTLSPGTVQFNNIANDAYYSFPNTDGAPSYLNGELPGAEGTLTISLNSNGRSTFAAVDYIVLAGSRQLAFQPGESYIEVFTPDYRPALGPVAITSAPADLMVWDVTSPANVAILPCSADADGTMLARGLSSEKKGGTLVAFSLSGDIKGIDSYVTMPNQNLHALAKEDAPAMLIIATPDTKEAAEKLAHIHEVYQDEKVVVTLSDQIINEFSQGTPDPMAYRAISRMLYDADDADNTRTFASVLLFGPVRTDNRSICNQKPSYPLLLCKESKDGDSPTTSFTTLDYYGQLADYYSDNILYQNRIQDIAVGIIPAESPAVAEMYVNKVAYWLNDNKVAYWLNDVIYTADGSNENEHQLETDRLAQHWKSTDNAFVNHKIYNNCYPADDVRNNFITTLNRGAHWINYLGHASSNGLNTLLWSKGDYKTLKNEHLPFMLLGGCTITNFDIGGRGSAEEMVLSSPLGSIGALMSTRSALSTSNYMLLSDIISSALRQNPFGTSNIDRRLYSQRTYGEMVRMAMNYNSRNNSNKLAYSLVCDPALRSVMPTASVDISIDGEDMRDCTTLPGSRITFSGQISKRNTLKFDDFNGTAVIKLYGAAHTAPTRAEGDSQSINIEHDDMLLHTASYEVNDGLFSGTLAIPANIGNAGDIATLRIAAFDPTTRRSATGFVRMTVRPYSAEAGSTTDTQSPEVERFYADRPSFISGDAVGPDPVLHAVVTDNEAVSSGNSNFGPGLSLTIDGNRVNDNISQYATVADEGRTLNLRLPLSDLACGMHTATLKASDISGNTCISTILFNVQPAAPQGISVEVETTTVRDTASFTIASADNASCIPESPTLVIIDELGNEVRNIAVNNLAATWDATDSAGQRVAPGTYYALCRFTTATGTAGITAPVRLVVIRASIAD